MIIWYTGLLEIPISHRGLKPHKLMPMTGVPKRCRRRPRSAVFDLRRVNSSASLIANVPLVCAAIVSGDENPNTAATWYRSLDTQTVDWRHRIASSGRVASRGLHYHASTRNWPMIAGGRLHSYNDVRTGFVILTLETLTQNKRNNGIHTKGSIIRA